MDDLTPVPDGTGYGYASPPGLPHVRPRPFNAFSQPADAPSVREPFTQRPSAQTDGVRPTGRVPDYE